MFGLLGWFRSVWAFWAPWKPPRQKKYEEGIGWGDAKSILYERLREFLSPYKTEYNKIIQDRPYVESVLSIGKEKALEISSPLIKDLREAIGIKGF